MKSFIHRYSSLLLTVILFFLVQMSVDVPFFYARGLESADQYGDVNIYFQFDQRLKARPFRVFLKKKSEWYKKQHYFKTGFRSIKKAIAVWGELGSPETKEEFFDLVEGYYGYEIATLLSSYISTISKTIEEIKNKYNEASILLSKEPNDRKRRAIWIQSRKDELFRSLAFLSLSGKPLDSNAIKKALIKGLLA